MCLIEAIPKNKVGRPSKYDNNFYVHRILFVLYSGCTWEEAAEPFCDESTLRKKFNMYVNLGIFTAAYDIINKEYTKEKQFWRTLC